jgi:hypothetical protein
VELAARVWSGTWEKYFPHFAQAGFLKLLRCSRDAENEELIPA